jgi:hypothetical protein
MTPQTFITKWQAGGSADALSERAGAQAHFLDLCELLGQEKPANPDNYCFERGTQRTGGNHGWADVWKRGTFGWENKGSGRDLRQGPQAADDLRLALDNPPLLVVCRPRADPDPHRTSPATPIGSTQHPRSKTSARRKTGKAALAVHRIPRALPPGQPRQPPDHRRRRRPLRRPRRGCVSDTGAPSTSPSSAPCSSAGSTPPNAASWARTTPTRPPSND